MKPVLPGATIGMLGSGQLGRMFAIAARRMGYRVHTLSPHEDTPTGQVSDLEVIAPLEDLYRVREFARGVDVVTFEFENVPVETAEAAAELVPVRPAGRVLHTTQQRIREKTFLEGAGLPVAPFRIVRTLADLAAAVEALGTPSILKTAAFGYDGKGQARVASADQAEAAWASIGRAEAVIEAFIDFECEVSVVAARGLDGCFVHYGAVENRHQKHILDLTIAPAGIAPRTVQDAVEMARVVLEKLDVVGVMCIEYFVRRNGSLLINELAPRPHNSGHFTFDACITSQFEQQLRAACGLPLGSTEQVRPAAMANLLGDLWAGGEPDWAAACSDPCVKLHLYGKTEPRPGRKMGHLTALADSTSAALRAVTEARKRLTAYNC
jgi:5-(carboxyamino)imidazole ribonucleotide synthase